MRVVFLSLIIFVLTACTITPVTTPTPAETATTSPSLTPTVSDTPVPTKTFTPVPTKTLSPTLTPIPVIAPNNATNLVQLYRLGNGWIRYMSWWPDPSTLTVVTNVGLFLFSQPGYKLVRAIEPPENSIMWISALDPNGKHIASSQQNDPTIRLWDIGSRSIKSILDVGESYVKALAFSPDGKYLASLDYEQIILWDIETSKAVKSFKGTGFDLLFSQDGKILISSGCSEWSCNDPLKIWDVENGFLITSFNNDFSLGAISPDGETVALFSLREIFLRDAKTGYLKKKIQENEGQLGAIAFSLDGERFVTGGSWGTPVRVRDAQTGEVIQTLSIETYSVQLLFSPDGNKLIFGWPQLQVWDVTKNRLTNNIGENNWFNEQNFSEYSPNGKLIAGGGVSGKVWDAQSGRLLFEPYNCRCSFLKFSPNGQTFVADGWDNTIQLLSSSTGERIDILEGEAPYRLGNPTFSPDGRFFLGKDGEEIKVWNIQTGKHIYSFPGEKFIISPTEAILAVRSERSITFIDLSSGKVLKDIYISKYIHDLAYSPDGKILVTASERSVDLWDVSDYLKIDSFPSNASRSRFSPDGKYLVWNDRSYSGNGTLVALKLLDVQSKTIVREIRGELLKYQQMLDIQFSPDSQLIFTVGLSEYATQIWDVSTGNLLWSYIRMPTILEDVIDVSPDGRYFSFVGRDGAIRVFGLP